MRDNIISPNDNSSLHGFFSGLPGSICEYADDAQVPEHFALGSGLRLRMPAGHTLTILEIREQRRRATL